MRIITEEYISFGKNSCLGLFFRLAFVNNQGYWVYHSKMTIADNNPWKESSLWLSLSNYSVSDKFTTPIYFALKNLFEI